MQRRITEETRARVLELDARGWSWAQIVKELAGTDHEVAESAVSTIVATKNYGNG